jgi:hypothetical protein
MAMEVAADAARRFLVTRQMILFRFAGASRLEWAPHLGRERRLLLTRP